MDMDARTVPVGRFAPPMLAVTGQRGAASRRDEPAYPDTAVRSGQAWHRDAATRRDAAVASLFDAHYAGLCRLATLLLDDRAQAEEVVQEAFLRAFAGWHRIRYPERAGAYLRSAVVNGCRSRGRRRAAEARGNQTVWAQTRHGDPASDPERRADAIAVWQAVRALPPRQREAVVLRYYADLTEAAVAVALGCSVGTVKSQLAKARASLARRLAEVRHGPASQEVEGHQARPGPGPDAHAPTHTAAHTAERSPSGG